MPELSVKDLITVHALSKRDIDAIFRRTVELKGKWAKGVLYEPLQRCILAMIFEKPSLRTRFTFEVAITQLGGHAVFMKTYPRAYPDIHLENVEDQARFLSKISNAIAMRTYQHETIEKMARFASIPVINGLSDDLHPCQALTDLYTIFEEVGKLTGLKLAYIGDGGSNTCHSLLLSCSKLGINISVGCPPEKRFRPKEKYWNWAIEEAKKSGVKITVEDTAHEAVSNADVIYTDTWISMGMEAERAERLRIFAPYQVNRKLITDANEDVIVLHCLPAHRGEEITNDVLTGEHSRVYQQAENRLHVQKSLLTLLT